ncbi:hypothetical protein [Actinomadura sp. 6N118]|uniref:hypothetical protein n=1 Tax=Actinomadura sp. 6N118 TaxID=3375151 RepID=UPI0037A640FB
MATERITVTVPEEALAVARAAVNAGRAKSVSAYISEATAERARREQRTQAIVDRWGPFPPEAFAWATDVLGSEGDSDSEAVHRADEWFERREAERLAMQARTTSGEEGGDGPMRAS